MTYAYTSREMATSKQKEVYVVDQRSKEAALRRMIYCEELNVKLSAGACDRRRFTAAIELSETPNLEARLQRAIVRESRCRHCTKGK
jgi:hypothetical protein